MAAGALLGCGSGLLETNQESLLRLNLSLGDLSSGLLNRSRISEALRGANVTALLLQAETALVSLGPRESGSGADGAAAAQASSTPPSPPSPPLDTSDLLGLLDGALNLGGAGTALRRPSPSPSPSPSSSLALTSTRTPHQGCGPSTPTST